MIYQGNAAILPKLVITFTLFIYNSQKIQLGYYAKYIIILGEDYIADSLAMKYRTSKLYILFFSCLFLTNCALADWITDGYFSEATGIDSLERFLVISDTIDSTYFGYNILPLGDINDDKLSDVLIVRADYLPGQDHNSFLYYGGNPPDTNYVKEFTYFTIHLRGIGDVNSDGYTDFANYNGHIYYGGLQIDDISDHYISNVWTNLPKAVDLDNDGVLELPLSESLYEGDVNVFRLGTDFDSTPEYTISDTAKCFGTNIATLDFNGDSYPDLAVAAHLNRDSCFVKFYWGGPDFDTTADFEIYGFNNRLGEFLLPVGDFNGDGYEDIFIGGSSPVRYGIYYGGPDFDDEIDVVVNHAYGTTYNVPHAICVAGDVNNDGHPDLIYSHLIPYLSEIYIILGGPDADSLYDINIENDEIPHPQFHFGTALAGIGDFNGDGIDDFVVRSQTEPSCCWRSEVNFFAGWNSGATDVDNHQDTSLPKSFKLYQNYPNPFNPSTSIEFELPRKDVVTLEIFNILGQSAAVLISNQTLSAGHHTAYWNGTMKDCSPAPSGIYFYKISGNEFSESRRMVLLK